MELKNNEFKKEDLKKVILFPEKNIFKSNTDAIVISYNSTFASGDSYYARFHYNNLFDEIKKSKVVLFPSSFHLHKEENKPMLYLSNISTKIYSDYCNEFRFDSVYVYLENCLKSLKKDFENNEINNIGFSLMDSYNNKFQKFRSDKFTNTLDSNKVIKTIDEIFSDFNGNIGIYNIK